MRTATAIAWALALPPIPAMIGMNTASTGIFSIKPVNTATTAAAAKAVARFTISQPMRMRKL